MTTLQRHEWALVLRHLDEALGLPAAEREAWWQALALAPPHLKHTLGRLLQDRAAIETAGFLQAGAAAGLADSADKAADQPSDQAADQPDAWPGGGRIGPWQLLRRLGQGGMASVWLARRHDGAHERPVALKLPHAWLGAAPEAPARARVLAARFARERA